MLEMNLSFVKLLCCVIHNYTHSFCPATLNGVFIGSCCKLKSKFYRGTPLPGTATSACSAACSNTTATKIQDVENLWMKPGNDTGSPLMMCLGLPGDLP